MVVVDTSVAYKWFNEEEPNSDQSLVILKSHLLKETEILAPDLIIYELANAWSTKGNLEEHHIKDNLDVFSSYKIKIIPISLDLIEKAVELSKKQKVSVYDAVYAVLAKDKKCDLITADKKFADKANLSFVKTLNNLD